MRTERHQRERPKHGPRGVTAIIDYSGNLQGRYDPPIETERFWETHYIFTNDEKREMREVRIEHAEGMKAQQGEYDLMYDLEVAERMAAIIRKILEAEDG